jgi:hypothetical protein
MVVHCPGSLKVCALSGRRMGLSFGDTRYDAEKGVMGVYIPVVEIDLEEWQYLSVASRLAHSGPTGDTDLVTKEMMLASKSGLSQET